MYDVEKRISVDTSDTTVISCIDELHLWSAPFGLSLLETVKFQKNIEILDIGCGLGFPMLEIAQRFGSIVSVTCIDPWKEAVQRLRIKAESYNIKNISIIEGNIEDNDFPKNFFGLIISNNGINNVENLDLSLSECYRIAKPGTQFVSQTHQRLIHC